MTDDSWKELIRWVRIETRVFFSLFFFFCFCVLVDPITSPSYFYREKYENNGRVQFSSVVQVSFETIVGEESCWWSKRQSVPRHVRHFEDQCQDQGKKTDAWVSLQPYQPFWNEKKTTTIRDTHVASVSFSFFFVPFLCHCLPNRDSVATDDVV